MTDTPESRIRDLEREMASVQQRVSDLAADVHDLAPLTVSVAELKLALVHVQTGMTDLSADVAAARRTINEQIKGLQESYQEDRREREKAQKDALKDSRQWRRALILGSVTVLAALIAAAATIIAAGIS